jgi:hypothetical protein
VKIKRHLIRIICATLLAAASLAQEQPRPAQAGNADIAGLPAGRGIYYHAAHGWIGLPFTVLMPFDDGKGILMEVLNLGSNHAISEMPGSYANVQIANDARPTFYLRGIAAADLYLVRAKRKAGYRELRMPISGEFREWAHFRSEDVADVELQEVAADVVTVKPRTQLTPGEYAIATLFEPGARWIRFGYDFGLIAGHHTGQ